MKSLPIDNGLISRIPWPFVVLFSKMLWFDKIGGSEGRIEFS
jgi:hypothetical protein